MDYIIDIENKRISIQGKREKDDDKKFRYQTYLTYLSNTEIRTMCKNRLNEMLISRFYDNDMVKFLNTKTDKELYELP